MTAKESSVTIENGNLMVTVNPSVGGTITGIEHRPTGLSVLGVVPWDAIEAPIASFAARDEFEWLTRYTGGWPLLFPNGGDACSFGGVSHGFHGEASISPWAFTATEGAIQLSRRFYTVPVEMHRELVIEHDVLVIRERLRMQAPHPIDVMWGHHPTFGSDLLAGPVEITSDGQSVTADAAYDPAANPLRPGTGGHWPVIDGKNGSCDLSRPHGPLAALAYLHDFNCGWIAMRRLDNAIAVVLSWDAKRFPCAWLWYELQGTRAAPWYGRASLIGLEPNTTMPANGLANAKAHGGTLLRLQPGEELSTVLRLQVLKPPGAITSVNAEGRAK